MGQVMGALYATALLSHKQSLGHAHRKPLFVSCMKLKVVVCFIHDCSTTLNAWLLSLL